MPANITIIRSLLVATVAALVGFASAGAHPAAAEREAGSGDSVTFALTQSEVTEQPRPFQLTLRCDNGSVARAALVDPHRPASTVPHRSAGATCTAGHSAMPRAGQADEVTYTVRQGDHVLARRTSYSHDGNAVSTDFVVPPGPLHVDVEVRPLPVDQLGTPLRVMAFNVFIGGRLGGQAGEDDGAENLRQIIEFVRDVDPDVLFTVETDGAGAEILAGLNEGRPEESRYTGVQITREPDRDDRLWLFTRLEVQEVYPAIDEGGVSSFHFGGARLGLPDGGHVNAFPIWLHYLDGAHQRTTQAALETVLGQCRTHTDADIIATDHFRRAGMAAVILEERLRTLIGDDDAPVIIGGDLNTLSQLDWSERFAGAPGHAGLEFDWPVTTMFDDAGFTDTYRWANPDAGRFPGRTMSPIDGFGYAPARIDYVLARGDDVRVLGSHTRSRRLPGHQGTRLDDVFPFYSDHAAVVTDLVIDGEGPGPDPDDPPVVDEPEQGDAAWPQPPDGLAVPAQELTASASAELAYRPAGAAVDGDTRTYWSSPGESGATSSPSELTIDMGRVRTLTAVRYQPRIEDDLEPGMDGTVVRATVQTSTDGQDFTDAAHVQWDRSHLPKDVDLSGISARYVRFRVELGIGGVGSAAEITPYEQGGTPAHVQGGDTSVQADPDVVVGLRTFHPDCTLAYEEQGEWRTSNLRGHTGSRTRYSNVPESSATWTPYLADEGEYEVAIWWPDHPTATSSATYTVNAANGPHQVTIDPREQMGQWRTLGTWHFDAGTDGGVTLDVDSGSYFRTDSVRFRPPRELVPPQAPGGLTVDDTPAGPRLSWQPVEHATHYVVERRDRCGIWLDEGETVAPEFTITGDWSRSGLFRVTGVNETVVGDPSEPADVTIPPPGDLSVVTGPGDTTVHCDGTAAYAETGTWGTSGVPGQDGTGTRWSNTTGSTATWTPYLADEGEYEVAIWWPEHTSTTSSATYTVHSGDGPVEVTIDPREQMGRWRTLGTWHFDTGTAGSLTLDVRGTGVHRAAGVRFRPMTDQAVTSAALGEAAARDEDEMVDE